MTETTTSTATTTDGETTDVLVVGSGIAGCAAALSAAREGADVLLLTKATKPADASTDWAQGGISTTRNDPESLKEDIIAASDGTADPAAVDTLVNHADDAVEDVLIDTLEIDFDETADGDLDYTREAAHSEFRILHVDAATGTHILRPFLQHVDNHERIEVRQDTAALELITAEGRVHGVVSDEEPTGKPIYAGATVLATGGIGALYSRSTNPDDATGDGIAMAALAGADVTDMEYIQFHPTAYDGEDPFLLSEALRGEGAILRNGDGERFMDDYHSQGDLAPRDVVAAQSRPNARQPARSSSTSAHSSSRPTTLPSPRSVATAVSRATKFRSRRPNTSCVAASMSTTAVAPRSIGSTPSASVPAPASTARIGWRVRVCSRASFGAYVRATMQLGSIPTLSRLPNS